MKSVLTIIPARRGSEGIPGKNKKLLCGSPLIEYSIRIAIELLNRYDKMDLSVSTNDPDIIDIARDICGSTFNLRPDNLSSNSSLIGDVISYEIEKASLKGRRYDSILLLQPTSPLRNLDDVETCVQFSNELDADSIVSVSQTGNSNPLTSYYVEGALASFYRGTATIDTFQTNRQNLPRVLSRNGAIYLIDTHVFISQKRMYTRNPWCYEMPRERSFNLDDNFDWELLETWMMSKEIMIDNFFISGDISQNEN